MGRFIGVILLVSLSFAQQPASKDRQNKSSEQPPAADNLKPMFEARIKDEWEAIKNKDKKALGALLADDYEGVEVDNLGERTKLQTLNELAESSNISSYTLWGLKVIPLGSDAAFVIYEVTQQFPPRSVLRYSRVYISELWVKRDGQWKILHYQETHVK